MYRLASVFTFVAAATASGAAAPLEPPRHDVLAAWRANYQDLCLTDGLRAARDTPQTRMLGDIVAVMDSEPDTGRGALSLLRQSGTALCIADDLGPNHGFYNTQANILYINPARTPAQRALTSMHESRHTHQKKAGILRPVHTSLQEATRLAYAAEADAMAVTARFAWMVRRQGDASLWDSLSAEPYYDDIPRAFSDAVASGEDLNGATRAAFGAWYDSRWRTDSYARATRRSLMATFDEWSALPKTDPLPAGYFDRLCDLPGGGDYGCGRIPALKPPATR